MVAETSYKIGFANQDERLDYARAVRHSLEQAAAQYSNIELITLDNALDDEQAKANAHIFAEQQVDLAMIYHINERLGSTLRWVLAGIPTMSIDIPIQLTTYVGINNSEMGQLAGDMLADWIDKHWQGQFDNLIGMVDQRVLGTVRDRVLKAVEVIHTRFPFLEDQFLCLDCGNTRAVTYEHLYDVLRLDTAKRTAIVSFNDVSTLGAQDVAQQLGIQAQVAIVGHAASDELIDSLQQADSCIVGSTLTYPERYGPLLLDCALRILRGEDVPQWNYVPLGVMHAESF